MRSGPALGTGFDQGAGLKDRPAWERFLQKRGGSAPQRRTGLPDRELGTSLTVEDYPSARAISVSVDPVERPSRKARGFMWVQEDRKRSRPERSGIGEFLMRSLNIITLTLVILGALNWGLMGLFQLDVVATLFAGPQSTLSRILYILVGLAGLYQMVPLINALTGEPKDVEDVSTSGINYERTAYDRDRTR